VPIAFLPENHALAIAIMSYNGKVDFGLLGDYDAMGDIEKFGEMLEDALAELLKEARKRTKTAAKASAKSNGVKKSGSDGPRAPSTRSPQASP
jgi:diacylglycerol O-acyltransferase / wax synthase